MAKDNKQEVDKTPSVTDGIFDAGETGKFFETLKDGDKDQENPAKELDSGKNGKELTVEEKIEAIEVQSQKISDKLDTVTKSYGESSGEALRLKTELNELAPYMPILKKMKDDPSLVQLMKTKIDEGKKPVSAVKALGLPDDFVFNPDEAIKDIDSDSAKVMRYHAKIETDISARNIEQNNQRIRDEDSERQNFDNFVEKAKLSSDEVGDFKKFMGEYKMTLEDVLLLKNRKVFAKNIAKTARAETIKQIEAARLLDGGSLGNKESVQIDTKDDDAFFESLYGKTESGIFSEL